MSDDQPIPTPISVGLDGGLNLKTDPQRLQAPAITRADNVWHVQPGNVQQLPGFVSQLAQAASFSHIYNMATRDLSPPSSTGDLLIHGEYPDNAVSGFTRSLWATNSGVSVTQNQSSLPFTARLRTVGNYLTQQVSIGNSAQSVYSSQLATARETGAVRPRFALATIQANGTNAGTLSMQTGYTDSTTRIAIGAGAANIMHMDAGEIQGTGNFVVIATTDVPSSFFSVYDYNLNIIQNQVSLGSTTVGFTSPLINVTQHNGRTLLGYLSGAAGYSPIIRDMTSSVTYTLSGITSSSFPANFAMASPYTHQTNSGVVYMALVHDRKLYVLSRSGTSSFAVVAGPVTLPPIISTIISPGRLSFATTVAVNVLDTQGGTGAGATLGITVFSHQYQADTDTIGTGRNVIYQFVTANNYRFVAAATNPQTTAGTLTNLGDFMLRTFGGVGLASKAFCMTPSEAQYAGAANAKQALVLVQTSAVEPEGNRLYNQTVSVSETTCRDAQPTYLLINHRCEIVGRFAEGQAPTRPANFCWAGTTSSPSASSEFPILRTLASPLFSQGTPDDTTLLSISIPAWVSTVFSFYGEFSDSNGYPYASVGQSSYISVPTFITLAMDRNGTSCTPLSTAAHVYMQGAIGQLHDGDQLLEQNYHLRPPPPIVSGAGSNTTPVANAAAGFYRLYVVWQWVDAQGFTHRSDPSIATTITQAAGAQIQTIGMQLGRPTGNKSVQADVFISPVVNSAGAVLLGSVNLGNITWGYTQASYRAMGAVSFIYDPATTPRGRAMYTEASATGVPTFASQSPRCAFHQIAGKGRAFALSQVTGQSRIYYSSSASANFPLEWNELNYATVPPDIGDARSLEMVDDKLVVLGTRGNAVMAGDGPAGGSVNKVPIPNDGFSPVTPVPTPAGVLGTGSPARVPEGVIFTGYSGIQLLGRDLSVQPLGANVDLLTGRQVGTPGTIYGRAVTLPGLQSVVYPNPRGPALVYSYLTKRWSTWPLLSNASCLVQRMDGTIYAALQPIGARQLASVAAPGSIGADIGLLSTLLYSPNSGTSTAPGLVVETPWLAIGGVTGTEADLQDAELIGTWLGPHQLLIEQAYNYRDYTLPQVIDMSTQPGEYMVRVRPLQNTRVWAVRYRISLQPTVSLNLGYPMADLSDLVLYSVTQGGTAQVAQTRTR